jgi:hypothetical protein
MSKIMNISTQRTLKIVFSLATIALLSSVFSCVKKRVVTYPDSINYGENLLSIFKDSIAAGESYSFEAELSKKSNLQVIITNLSSPEAGQPMPRWGYAFVDGWQVDNYLTDGTQKFTTIKQGVSDLKMVFSHSPGSCRMDFYENSSTITKTKTFKW